MAGLRPTMMELGRLRERWRELIASIQPRGDVPQASGPGRLTPVAQFGSNPGNLRMLTYAPEQLPRSPALVVVLHGCTQTAESYDLGSGWSTLADRYGFVLVFAEQVAANNPKTCFNWFLPGDTKRDAGEALSIRQMVDRAAADYGVDRRRVFVTGLSAGGAMAGVMLATYPEVFAGGAILAGLPYGSARNVQEALRAMFQPQPRPGQAWADLVRAASAHRGPWPRLSVWHGDADTVVRPENAGELVKQWTNLHGLPDQPSARGIVDGHLREAWRDGSGREVLESFTVSGMGHGTPLQAGDEAHMCGAPGSFLIEAGISSSYHIARFWGLLPERAARQPRRVLPALDVVPETARRRRQGRGEAGDAAAQAKGARPGAGAGSQGRPLDVGAVIDRALRGAGLLKR